MFDQETTIKFPYIFPITKAARTVDPLDVQTAVSYFEAKIINCRRRSDIGIGLISKDCALKKHPG